MKQSIEEMDVSTNIDNISEELKIFPGKWEGIWGRADEIGLVIKEITAKEAQVYLCWNDFPPFGIKSDSFSMTVPVIYQDIIE